ncbi:MAG: NINE protein [Bacteroidota bacterium]
MKEKNKTVAALLAIFTGWVGVHRFYLGQTGLGIFYIFLMFTGISFILSFIDFIVFMTMDDDLFDVKYNRHLDRDYRRYDTDFDRMERPENRRRRYNERMREREREREERIAKSRNRRNQKAPRPPARKNNPFKTSGIEKYKDYDYEGAVEDFNKALSIDSKDVAVHFNLACSYSLIEEKDKAFYHLSKAVEYGFLDFEKIKTHDALAYLRIQDEFDTFVQNNYTLGDASNTGPSNNTVATNVDLLEQLRQLGELREKGLLTEDEFQVQKKRLLDT